MDGDEVEGLAESMLDAAGLGDCDGSPPLLQLHVALFDTRPRWCPNLEEEAKFCPEERRCLIRSSVPRGRARWLLGHEMLEGELLRLGYRGADIEAVADRGGAALVAPHRAFRRAVRCLGHRIHTLATAFDTTQSLALLRVGETAGRPVLLMRPAGELARGDAFEWGSVSARRRAVERREIHPLRISDEASRWGLMATR